MAACLRRQVIFEAQAFLVPIMKKVMAEEWDSKYVPELD
jgi:hypothetical protein